MPPPDSDGLFRRGPPRYAPQSHVAACLLPPIPDTVAGFRERYRAAAVLALWRAVLAPWRTVHALWRAQERAPPATSIRSAARLRYVLTTMLLVPINRPLAPDDRPDSAAPTHIDPAPVADVIVVERFLQREVAIGARRDLP
jgi:hypothetical protein